MKIIGMMSGTSLDGVDAVLAEYYDDHTQVPQWRVLAHAEVAIPARLRDMLYRLNFPEQAATYNGGELHTAQTAEQQLTYCYAEVYEKLMAKTAYETNTITAIAAHGQTIRHEPNAETPYTVQLLNGALLSHLTAQTVVCDFRSKDIAAGGQGAPLAPLFHREFFANSSSPFAVVNIGGISNISILNDEQTYGFDCGPGNCLLDEWIAKYQGAVFDENGHWARQGRILPDLLTRLLDDDYFAAPVPKSTGRDVFHLGWLHAFLHGNEAPVDVMRTLTRLTATVIADSVPKNMQTVIVVGGGAKNPLLMTDIAELLPYQSVCHNDEFDAQHVEALGFAMLGRAALLRQPLATKKITGATTPVILGAIYY